MTTLAGQFFDFDILALEARKRLGLGKSDSVRMFSWPQNFDRFEVADFPRLRNTDATDHVLQVFGFATEAVPNSDTKALLWCEDIWKEWKHFPFQNWFPRKV